MQWYLNTQFFSTEGPLLTLQPFKKEICCSASFTDNSKIFELNAIQKKSAQCSNEEKKCSMKKKIVLRCNAVLSQFYFQDIQRISTRISLTECVFLGRIMTFVLQSIYLDFFVKSAFFFNLSFFHFSSQFSVEIN
jgi:hypothetical protein